MPPDSGHIRQSPVRDDAGSETRKETEEEEEEEGKKRAGETRDEGRGCTARTARRGAEMHAGCRRATKRRRRRRTGRKRHPPTSAAQEPHWSSLRPAGLRVLLLISPVCFSFGFVGGFFLLSSAVPWSDATLVKGHSALFSLRPAPPCRPPSLFSLAVQDAPSDEPGCQTERERRTI